MPQRIPASYNGTQKFPVPDEQVSQMLVEKLMEELAYKTYGLEKLRKDAETMLHDIPTNIVRAIESLMITNNTFIHFDGENGYINLYSAEECILAYRMLMNKLDERDLLTTINDEELANILKLAIYKPDKIDYMLDNLKHVKINAEMYMLF
jgi:hypothetical protein